MISWGCPNKCTYCINRYYHEMYGGFRMQRYSPERIVSELEHLTDEYGIEFYKFHDEDFVLKPRVYFEKLAELYAARVNVPFTCMANPRSVTEERVRLLHKMNCASVSLGIETGDMRLRRDLLNRTDTEEDIIRAFNMLRDAGIRTNSFNMLALPFETRNTFMETVRVNRAAAVQTPQASFFFPFQGTRLRQIAIEEGFYTATDESVYNPDKPALHFENLSEDELVTMRNRFVIYVKLPEEYWPFIERSETADETGRALEEKLYKIYNECVFANGGWFDDNGMSERYISELEAIVSEDSTG